MKQAIQYNRDVSEYIQLALDRIEAQQGKDNEESGREFLLLTEDEQRACEMATD